MGNQPIYAAIYNFVTLSMMFPASGLLAAFKSPADSRSRIFAGRATHPEAARCRSSARKSKWIRMRVRTEE